MKICFYKNRLYKHALMCSYESVVVPNVGELVELNEHTYRVVSRAFNYEKNTVFIVVNMVGYMPLGV